MCCGGIGLNSIMMNPMMMGGCSSFGWGGGCGSSSLWGYGFGGCCGFPEKPMLTGLGIGIGYAGANLLVAGMPKLINWIGGLFHKKSPDAASA